MGALVVMGTYFVLCGLCALAYWLIIAAWLYKASAKAGMNTTLWTVLGLIGNLLAACSCGEVIKKNFIFLCIIIFWSFIACEFHK